MQTKQDHAYHYLKQQILEGTLLPGQRIVVSRLTQQIGTSAIPVREALLRLDAEGLVEITPHVGAVVTHITGEKIVTTLETLAVTEGYATRLASGRSENIVDELGRLNQQMEDSARLEDWDRFSKANRSFHFAIYSVVPNRVLINTVEGLWAQLDSYLSASAFFLMPDRALGSVREHQRILDHLRDPNPDPDTIERLARLHKLNTALRLKPLRPKESTAAVHF
jgi:DNA-binding GntR family transcriptional regulator